MTSKTFKVLHNQARAFFSLININSYILYCKNGFFEAASSLITELFYPLGSGCSGKTTFLKQLRIVYGDGFTEKERREYKPIIYSNVRRAMVRILEAMNEIGLTFETEELKTGVC